MLDGRMARSSDRGMELLATGQGRDALAALLGAGRGTMGR
jgi:hypothetical protein